MIIGFTVQQNKALQAIESFLCGDKSIFILKGYTGTGKTTLIAPILKIASLSRMNATRDTQVSVLYYII